jgi:hypothetical protein
MTSGISHWISFVGTACNTLSILICIKIYLLLATRIANLEKVVSWRTYRDLVEMKKNAEHNKIDV